MIEDKVHSFIVEHRSDEQQKDEALSKKLTIAYGLLRTPSRTSIHISKNLCICVDGPTATKFIQDCCYQDHWARKPSEGCKSLTSLKKDDGLCSCGNYY